MNGNFIVVEGLEGAGKSTAIYTIEKLLSANKIRYIKTREPGGTRVGESVRNLLKESSSSEPLCAKAELLLLYAARVQLLEQVIRPALQQGIWVIADRFEASTYAYQGGGRKLNVEVIDYLSHFCVEDFKPDLLIFLDVSIDVGLKRARARGRLDRIEQESRDFFNAVHSGYMQYLHKAKNTRIINASESLREVRRTLRVVVDEFITLHKVQ